MLPLNELLSGAELDVALLLVLLLPSELPTPGDCVRMRDGSCELPLLLLLLGVPKAGTMRSFANAP
jgi:hypothetical protein